MSGCQAIEQIAYKLHLTYPHEVYARSLQQGDQALGERWHTAARLAKREPDSIRSSRYEHSGSFGEDEVHAQGFSIALKRGEALRVALTRKGLPEDRLFVELFRRGDNGWKHIESVETDGSATNLVAGRDAEYLVLVQPELGTAASYALNMETGGSLAFPVQGKNSGAVGSRFGDPRDGGARRHHGVDIFAERGTPVLAVASGWASAGQSERGGKVVWLWDLWAGRSYYYAHLDEISIDSGGWVEPGTILGKVGNTGNARNTPPHLHFGIYTAMSGPVDPLAYIRAPLGSSPN